MSLQWDPPGLTASRGPSNEESGFLGDTHTTCSLLMGLQSRVSVGHALSEKQTRPHTEWWPGGQSRRLRACAVRHPQALAAHQGGAARGGAHWGPGSSWRWFWWRGNAEGRPEAWDGWRRTGVSPPSDKPPLDGIKASPGRSGRPASGRCLSPGRGHLCKRMAFYDRHPDPRLSSWSPGSAQLHAGPEGPADPPSVGQGPAHGADGRAWMWGAPGSCLATPLLF